MGIFASIAAALGFAPSGVASSGVAPSAALRLPGGADAVAADLPLYEQYQRIGGNLTPAQVSSILYEADGGDIYRLVQLANECRQKDGHLQSSLGTRENALTTLPRTIDPFKQRGAREPDQRDRDVADFVEDAIAGAIGIDDKIRGFDDLLPHLQGGIFHGHATAQTVWRREGRYIVPAGFRLLGQRRFRFRQRDGQLVWSDRMGGTLEGVELQRKYPGHFIQHQPRVNGDVPAFEGLNRLLVWAALFRNWSIGDWMKLAELGWKPWRIGKYSKDASQEDREKLLSALQRMSTNSVAIHRNDHEIAIEWPKGGASGGTGQSSHAELCAFMGAEMSKAILGQTLTTEQGRNGARSLGEVHDKVRGDIRKADATAVWATLRRDLIAPLVRMNFGDVPVPKGWFETDDAVDLRAFSEAVENLRDAGMRVPEAWAHDQAGIPVPDDDERCLGDDAEEDVDTTDLDEPEPDEPAEPTPDPDELEQEDDEAA